MNGGQLRDVSSGHGKMEEELAPALFRHHVLLLFTSSYTPQVRPTFSHTADTRINITLSPSLSKECKTLSDEVVVSI